MTRFCAGPVV